MNSGANGGDAWSPERYESFRAERMQPFFDLARLIEWAPRMRAIDLGCGTGEQSVLLAERFDATVHGVDRSESMLERAWPRQSTSVSFALGDVSDTRGLGAYDLVFSNAALQWLPDHERWFPTVLAAVRSRAQLAVQMPSNHDHVSHRVAADLAGEEPFRSAFAHEPLPRVRVLPLERYAELLDEHGFVEKHCVERVYGHRLANTEAVVEWVRGTLLNGYTSELPAELGERFVREYRVRVLERMGKRAPYFFAFRRMLLWGRKT